jgi:predicted outer membrane repeat protein
MRPSVPAAFVCLGFAAIAGAATIHVPSQQPTIQAGIDAAAAGDTVVVACGTYYEHDIDMKSGVTLTSETGEPECVTVDGEHAGEPVFMCWSLDAATNIRGITITGGSHLDNPGVGGGGMVCQFSFLKITDVTFVDNSGTLGGALFCANSAPMLSDVKFHSNTAVEGGAVCCDSSSPSFERVSFIGNTSDNDGGAMLCKGHSDPSLMDVVFTANMAGDSGGALACRTYSEPSLTYVTFGGNSASVYGGGMFCEDFSSPMIVGATFAENSAVAGGALYCRTDSSPFIMHSIIAFSTAGEAIDCDASSAPTVTCSDVYGNAGGDWVGCIAAYEGVGGNISEDPLFCGAHNPAQPYTLEAGSSCLPGGTPHCGQIGAWGPGCSESGTGEQTNETSWGVLKGMFR